MLHAYSAVSSAVQILAWPVSIKATTFFALTLLVCAVYLLCVSTILCPSSPLA